MIGNVRSKTSINATISSNSVLRGSLGSSTILGDIKIGTVQIIRRDFPNYDGEYEATPSIAEQVLPTKNKSMLEDFVVREIPYAETSNPSGGYTAIIGG